MENEKVITITSGTIFKAILIILLFVLAYLFRELILVLLTAVVIASAVEPLTRWLFRYKVPRVLSVILIYLVFLSFFFGVLYLFVPPLLSEVTRALSGLSGFIETFDTNIFLSETTGFLGAIPESFSLVDTIAELRGVLTNVSGGMIKVASSIFGGVFSFILIIVFSFYLAVQEKGIENFLRLVTPTKHELYIINLWERTQAKIGRWMQGQLLLGILVGVLVYLGLVILGAKYAPLLEYAFLLAMLAAIFELIPLFGPILSAIPAVAIGLTDSVTAGLLVVGLYVIIQQFENHLIYPLVVRNVVGVSPIIVIISLIVGAELAGFLGLLLAVPVAAALMEFAEDIQKEKRAHKI